MKSRKMMCVVLTLLATVTLSTRLPAQVEDKPTHHHYQLIDIGTFGGPSSYFNNLNLTDRFGFGTAFYGFAQVRNQRGVLVGFAETRTPDPYAPSCYVPECFVSHAFQWQGGVKTDLGTLPGGASSAAFWINAPGLIVGNSQNGELDPVIPGLPQIRAALWHDGNITDLGTLGGNESYAVAVNDRGQVTGLAVNTIPDPFSLHYLFLYFSSNGTQTRAFLWDKKEGMQDLGTLGGPDAASALINNRGQIAGFSYTNWIPNPTTGYPTLHPFLWESGKGMKDLGSFGGTATASVNGLNERGEVVGGNYLPGDVQIHPFLWDGKELIDLTAPPFGGNANGEATWINEAGDVVGLAELPVPCPGGQSEVQHAFLWSNGVMADLGTVAGTLNSQASFINSKRQVVGLSFACDFSIFNAILWEKGSMVDMNTLIPLNSGFHLYSASFIDDRGEIAAFGVLLNGDTHAILLIPCDEDHPDIEGCDYSLVDGSAPSSVSATAEVPQNPAASSNLGNFSSLMAGWRARMAQRYHIPGLGAPRNQGHSSKARSGISNSRLVSTASHRAVSKPCVSCSPLPTRVSPNVRNEHVFLRVNASSVDARIRYNAKTYGGCENPSPQQSSRI